MENNPCEPMVLVENYDARHKLCIVQCKHCLRIGFMYNNLLADFDVNDFMRFSAACLKLDF